MQKFVFFSVIAFCGCVFFVSCNTKPKKKKEKVAEVAVVQNDNPEKKSFVYTKYELPLSINIFKFSNKHY